MNIDRNSNIHRLETALSYCNDGIQLYSDRDFEGAIVYFANALDVAKQVIRNPSSPTQPRETTSTTSSLIDRYGKRSSCVGHVDEDAATISSEARINLLDLGMAASLEEYFRDSSVTTTSNNSISSDLQERQVEATSDDMNTTSSSQNPSFFIFPKPIRPESMLPQNHGMDRRDHTDYDLCTVPLVLASIMIFNLAIAYQMAATTAAAANNTAIPDDEESQKLKMARKLYELLLVYLQPLRPSSGIFNIVILNNLSVIQRRMGHQEESVLTFNCLMVWIVRSSFEYSSSSACSQCCPSDYYHALVDRVLKNARNTIIIRDGPQQEETTAAAPSAGTE